ncbi:MAG TPA: M48 family peptidase, partial [Rhodocyclaceae bacterium]|nr:M48 family peptidase [Rhodocyclaceae bacterium]
MASTFSLTFICMLALATAMRFYLAYRHWREVQAKRAAVPPRFVENISLEAHQKAADYTTAKLKLGVVELGIEVLLLLGWTLGGGLQTLHDFWSPRVEGLVYGVALIFSVVFISGLIDLPFNLYRQFGIEVRFGFNRMTFGLFVRDIVVGTAVGIAIGTPALLAVLWLMNEMGSNWWLYVWGFWCTYALLITFLFPTVIQ